LSSVAARPELPLLRAGGLRRPGPELLFGAALTAVLAAIGLRGGGGLSLGPTTSVEIALDLVAGVLAALAILTVAPPRRWWGGVTVALFAVLAGVTALSITWAVQPSDAWLEANRTVAWLAVFAAGALLARVGGAWGAAAVGALCAACAIISGWAILTKVFPGALASAEVYARLREPYGYWNAVGLTAALGVAPTLWLGARRTGHGAVNALAYPVMGVLLLTVLLAYSRGSLLAVAIGCIFWFALTPLRLRGVAVLASGALGALVVSAWAFAQDTLTKDRVAIDARATSGHELGVAVLAMILVLLLVGLVAGFANARSAPSAAARRRAGATILGVLALVPVALVVALALSHKGLGGSISSGWRALTDPNDQTKVANRPDRLTSVGSVRARYWNEAFKIWKANKVKGVGAGGYATARLRYRNDGFLAVRHAHGFLPQTAADLGVIGVTTSLALLLSWIVAAGRTLGWRPRIGRRGRRMLGMEHAAPRAGPAAAEYAAMVTLTAVVVVFGVHSFVDWTWFVPGTAVMGLFAAGWVAGRGPLTEPPGRPVALPGRWRAGLRSPLRIGGACLVLAIGLMAALTTWQPLRAVHADNEALAIAADDYPKARALAEQARDRNPLSIDPLTSLAFVELAGGHADRARRALVDAVRLQPANPATWEYLARFALDQQDDPQLALRLLGPALYLDPKSPTGARDYLDASRRAAVKAQEAAQAKAKAKAKAEAQRRRAKRG